MKKRLLVMLLLLCLLLTALTVTVGADTLERVASGLYSRQQLVWQQNGRYRCESNHTTGVLYAEDHKLLSVEAKKSDGTVVPIADGIGRQMLAKVEIPNFNCSRRIEARWSLRINE
ncbi:MAG: hypothetical protein V8T01_03630 [Oscillospiraceae bacterium]